MADQAVAGDPRWYLLDYQNSVRDVIDGAGAILAHIRYGAFGERLDSAGTDVLFGYTGRD